MKVEWVNPFIQASFDVLHSFGLEPERGEIGLRTSPMTGHEVSVAIGVTGDIKGQVIIGMEKETALGIARAMIPWGVKGFDEMARSSISELANMLCGHASSNFAALKVITNLSVPSMFIGKDVEISTFDGVQSLVIPLQVKSEEQAIGLMELAVLLRQ